MGKDKRGINPADAFRREEKKRQQKRNAVQKHALQEVRSLLNDVTKIDAEIEKVQAQSAENRLDKSLKDRIIELKKMRDVAEKKQRIDSQLGRGVPTAPSAASQAPTTQSSSSSSSLIPPPPTSHPPLPLHQRHRRPDESVYYHPVFNPSGAPPPGMAPMFRALPQQPQARQPMAVGGMNGIPLPPPRGLPFGATPPPPPQCRPPHTAGAQQQRERPRRERARDADENDPLDPAARDYLGFGRRERERETERARESYSESAAAGAPVGHEEESEENVVVMQNYHFVGPATREEGAPTEREGESESESEKESGGLALLGMYDSGSESESEDESENEENVAVSETERKRERETESAAQSVPEEAVAAPPAEQPRAVKRVRADAALTAMVPSVLRNREKKFAPAPPCGPPPPPAPATVPSTAPTGNPSLEDEYLQFMNELEGL